MAEDPLDNFMLKVKKKDGPSQEKIKAAKRPPGYGGSKAVELLGALPDMKLAEVRANLRARSLNPLGSIEETKDRLRESLEAERDWIAKNVNSIQYREAAREARKIGDLPIYNYYNPKTSDQVFGSLTFHSTGQYKKDLKIKLKKNHKVKSRVIHEFHVPGGKLRLGYIDVVGVGWGEKALEFVTVNDWPAKNITWEDGESELDPPSHWFEFRRQWYQIVYRGNPLMGKPSLARCDTIQDEESGVIKLIFRYMGKLRDMPALATHGAVPKRVVRRYDVYGVRAAIGPQPKGYEEAVAALDHKEYLEEQHVILEELKAEREEWFTAHDEQGYLYYSKVDGTDVDTGGKRQYEVPEVQQLLDQQLTMLGYMPDIVEEKLKARRAAVAAEKEAERQAKEEAHAKKVAGIKAELEAIEKKYEAMEEATRQEMKIAKRSEMEIQLHTVRLQVKQLREYLMQVAGQAALSGSAIKQDREETKDVMEFKPLTEEERLQKVKEDEEERLRKEEEDLNDPDQAVGDPRGWKPRAVYKWFMASKVDR